MKVDDNLIKAVLDEYGDMLYFLALHYVRTDADAEDIVQDALLAFIKRGGMDIKDAKFWLIRVTINKCLDFIKKQRRLVSYEYIKDQAATEQIEQSDFDLIRTLAPIDREIFFLHYSAGYTTKEIAKFTHKSDSNVRKHLQRARSKLKNLLE